MANAFDGNVFNGMDVALGFFRFTFAGLIGGISGGLTFSLGLKLAEG